MPIKRTGKSSGGVKGKVGTSNIFTRGRGKGAPTKIKRTGGKLNLASGALYGSINKMLEQGLIEESEERPDSHLDDERRRYYRITTLGRRVAQAEAVRLQQLVRLAADGLGVPGLA